MGFPLRSLRANAGMGAGLVVLLALLGVLVVGGLAFSGTYNALVGQQASLEQKASDLDSQMKRRADLVPNLVATVKGYATHEKEVFTNIAAARSRLLNSDVKTNPAEAAEANSAMTGALGRLLAIAENYPQLKADAGFNRLQDELTGTENRINYARLQFNEGVKQYNIAVRTFPTNIMAGWLGFAPKENFKATETEKAVPQVQF